MVQIVALAIGQAGGRSEITPERVGINIDDARIKDNQGHQPIDQVIRHDGAPAYFSNLARKTSLLNCHCHSFDR
jgi:pyroglutamyl-peptidase